MNDLQLEQYISAHNKQADLIDKLKKELEEYRNIAERMGAAKAISEKEQWEKCADRLFVYAEETQATITNRALYEVVCEDIAEYKRLKNET